MSQKTGLRRLALPLAVYIAGVAVLFALFTVANRYAPRVRIAWTATVVDGAEHVKRVITVGDKLIIETADGDVIIADVPTTEVCLSPLPGALGIILVIWLLVGFVVVLGTWVADDP